MEKRLSEEEVRALRFRRRRSDTGKRHKAGTHGSRKVGQYDLAGRLERVFDTLADAVDRNTVGATYQGILACCNGTYRKHAGKTWRWDASSDTSSDLLENIEI